MMHKTCSINHGHLVDLQKTLPTIDLNKKNLSFDKISPRDFYFCPFFSICTCLPLVRASGLKLPRDAHCSRGIQQAIEILLRKFIIATPLGGSWNQLGDRFAKMFESLCKILEKLLVMT